MIGLVKGVRETAARLNRAAAQYPSIVRQAMFRIGLVMRQKLVQRMSAPTDPHPFWGRMSTRLAGYISARSGKTRSRVSIPAVTQTGTQFKVAVGSPDAHVAFLERGGTRSGTSPGGFLRIPTGAAMTAAGVDRLTGASARTLVGAFILKSKAGNLWIATRGRLGELVLLYLLKRSATYRPRGIFAAVAKEIDEVVQRLGNQALAQVARVANG